HRSNHEITLIDWASGQVAWRLGGPNSDFTFPNDGGFKSQHDARFAGNNRISLFDNRFLGTVTTPRALVYALDTVLWQATREYERVEPNSESPTMGSFRELPNGDGLVCWGQILPEDRPNLSYFQANGQKVCDWQFQVQHLAYRAVCSDLPFPIARPEIICDEQNGNLVLSVQGSYPSYLWSSGESTSLIQVSDTGYYQVYVPLGDGFVGSNVIHVTDLSAGCSTTPVADPRGGGGRPPRLVGVYDLLGRPVNARLQGHIYLERYDNGQSRKVIQL
ncbi:MAG TPA: arylsulfotransferase family protein, partial [Bacteroidia bacterium]|nr:arylsulfotransferase family protein [Bacteroidia bacterium]